MKKSNFWLFVNKAADLGFPKEKQESREEKLTEEMSTGMDGMSTEIEGMSTEIEGMSTQIDGRSTQMDGRSTQMDGRSTQMDGRSTQIDGRSTQMDGRSTQMDGHSTQIEQSYSTKQRTASENSQNDFIVQSLFADTQTQTENTNDTLLAAQNIALQNELDTHLAKNILIEQDFALFASKIKSQQLAIAHLSEQLVAVRSQLKV
jgi:hypothetical protein